MVKRLIYICLMMMWGVMGPALAAAPVVTVSGAKTGTPITTQQTNDFYTQCRNEPLALNAFSDIQKELFCSCVAVNMQKNLVVEDIRLMQDIRSAPGRAALAKMLEKVHLPCALRPIEDSVRQECITRAAANPQYAAGGQKYCGCLANKTMNYVRTVGVSEALYKLTTTGELVEPMEALTQSGGYQNELLRNYYTCFDGALP